jgi:hypothetical protein
MSRFTLMPFRPLARWMRTEPPAPDPAAFLEMVVDALRLVALPADEQIAALPDFVDVPTEVLQRYEDAWVLVPQIREAGLLSDEQHEALARLDRHHTKLSEVDEADALWTAEGMRNDERWVKSRQLARDALERLGRPPGKPAFRGVTWIPAGD